MSDTAMKRSRFVFLIFVALSLEYFLGTTAASRHHASSLMDAVLGFHTFKRSGNVCSSMIPSHKPFLCPYFMISVEARKMKIVMITSRR